MMMEKLGAPQTHLGLKAMIKEVDEDDDSAISFREFLMIFRKARAGELDLESGLGRLATLSEVDVDMVGVGGAKTFFEAKVSAGGYRHIHFQPSYRLLRFPKEASLRKKSRRSRRRGGEKRRTRWRGKFLSRRGLHSLQPASRSENELNVVT